MNSLFGDSSRPAGYLLAPQYLDEADRLAYKKALIPPLRDIEEFHSICNSELAGGHI